MKRRRCRSRYWDGLLHCRLREKHPQSHAAWGHGWRVGWGRGR